MSHSTSMPPLPAGWANLADDRTGAFVLYATDGYFAEKENLIRPDAPVWKADAYTDRGKWMDGWETQRKRGPGHDFVILRLGMPGRIGALLVDTTHFKGNAAPAVSLEILDAAVTTPVDDLVAHEGWTEVLPRTAVLPDHANYLEIPRLSERATHIRLHNYPDGGIARLRVLGPVVADPSVFWQQAAVDLAAVEHGGTIAYASDAFFGPPSNLLLPGRGVNMGDGWETRRRRTPGTDWCVVQLGRRGRVQRVEVDTHFFKGNAPQSVRIDSLDAEGVSADELAARLADRSEAGWATLVPESPTVQHHRHMLVPDRPLVSTHLRVHMRPHGGINRMRVFGSALDTAYEAERLHELNALSVEDATALMLSLNGSTTWAKAMVSDRPFANWRSVFAAADQIWWTLRERDYLEAFAAHPRIGGSHRAASATQQSATWSTGEQATAQRSAEETKAELAALNDAYFDKFGFIYIVFASGRSAEQLLAILQQRLPRTREQEVEQAACEQAKITRLRIGKWIGIGPVTG